MTLRERHQQGDRLTWRPVDDGDKRAVFRLIANAPNLTAADRGDIAEALGLTPTTPKETRP